MTYIDVLPPLVDPAPPASARAGLIGVNRSMPRRSVAVAEQPMISVKDLTIGWGDIIIQKDLSFAVKNGEVFGILGGSGA